MSVAKGKNADQAVKRLPSQVQCVLIFGPDEGLVQERANQISKQVVADISDPFNVVRPDNATLREHPAALADELSSLSLMGGRRLVRMDGMDSRLSVTPFELALNANSGDNLLVITAGDLKPKHKIRDLFEKATNALAIPCYQDGIAEVEGLVHETLRQEGLSAEPEAISYLISNLGSDRSVTRGSLEKLSLYMASAEDKRVTLDDVKAIIGDNAALHLGEIAASVTAGDARQLEILLDRAEQQNESAVAILRAVQMRLQRLYLVRAHIDDGLPIEAAMNKLWPRVIYFEKPAFSRAVQLWSGERLGRALAICLEAERQTKSTGAPTEAICSRTCLQLAVNAPRSRR